MWLLLQGFDIDLSRPMTFHIIRLPTAGGGGGAELETTISVNMAEFTSAAANNSLIVSHTVNG